MPSVRCDPLWCRATAAEPDRGDFGNSEGVLDNGCESHDMAGAATVETNGGHVLDGAVMITLTSRVGDEMARGNQREPYAFASLVEVSAVASPFVNASTTNSNIGAIFGSASLTERTKM